MLIIICSLNYRQKGWENLGSAQSSPESLPKPSVCPSIWMHHSPRTNKIVDRLQFGVVQPTRVSLALELVTANTGGGSTAKTNDMQIAMRVQIAMAKLKQGWRTDNLVEMSTHSREGAVKRFKTSSMRLRSLWCKWLGREFWLRGCLM